ncbi:MAG TPA: hypothetical protein VK818_13620 [Methylomirabilota bacterium]|nr:hypothetical protein [Methylomirabilota bacterium]
MQFNNPSSTKMKPINMTTIHLTTSTGRSPLRPGLLFIPLALFLALAGVAGAAQEQAAEAQAAQAQIPPPVCPGPDCRKVITIYNNTAGPIFAVIQAGIQNPDPWLQAYFNNNNRPYAETHYSRAYVNPENGIPARTHVSVTVPWYSELQGDEDAYVDWYNGCRIYFFDTKAALDAAHEADKEHRLSFTDGSPRVSCADCEHPLSIYKDKTLFDDNEVQFQLVEYTFASVGTDKPQPYIINLNVGYNVSYLDQIYLPLALAPCGTEPCNGEKDPTAVGYLGTIQNLGPQEDKSSFRDALNRFANDFGWPQYKSPLDNQERRPHLPGTFKVLIDRVNVEEKHRESHFTTPPGTTPPGRAIRDLINQWQTCTSNNANADNCPQFEKYKELDAYFRGNYRGYRTMGNLGDCPKLNDPLYYPVPDPLTDLNILPYVYGWVPFNSGCHAHFNALKLSPGPESEYHKVQFDYINYLQYNYETQDLKQRQWFNPFVRLVHGKEINASSYAFSVDDAAGFQQKPGEGLIIAIGGAEGLPNKEPIVPPANYKKDFLVTLGDSKALKRPRWKSFGVCKDVADKEFPPLPKDAKIDSPDIIVDTIKYKISPANPCTITVKDAADRKYQLTVSKSVPWPTWDGGGHDPTVVTSVIPNVGWNINEVAQQAPPRFALLTEPPLPK